MCWRCSRCSETVLTAKVTRLTSGGLKPKIGPLNAIPGKRKYILAWGQLIVNIRTMKKPTKAYSRVCGARKRPPFWKSVAARPCTSLQEAHASTHVHALQRTCTSMKAHAREFTRSRARAWKCKWSRVAARPCTSLQEAHASTRVHAHTCTV